ncbi:hypothetical protein CA54_50900 [Symmachiella macrocystis]|uniref:DUF1501 domain-containing protein n=1 Tax=Symmachiella macrocystis TaxID=2527985 RepID=A0A5C6B5C6_9PLAN|nr:DUF1501 domain-containing protein [Symmachiella macrocystis]TWU06691.1 hypothetical protein CA54_50900 [Symmachiella macrocystis]
MFNLGRQSAQHCGGISRRELLRAGSLAALGLSLGDLLRLEATAALRPNAPAKSVILLWLWGGPSHLDTFDLKPNAPLEYRGPYSPIATNVPGIDICEMLPQLARRADKYAIVRSLHCESNDHGIAGTIGLTGAQSGAISLSGQTMPGDLKPAHGAVISKLLGFQPTMPRFVTLGGHLHQGHRRIAGEGGGPLGTLHDPFRLDYDPEAGVKIPQLDLIDGLTPDGLSSRRGLLKAFDEQTRRVENSAEITQLDSFYQQAFSLLTSPDARKVFDLNRESDALRTQYGRFRFGQCCLLSRRLIEQGARFVQVNWSSHVEPVEDRGDGGWDMHDRNFIQFQERHAWMLDQSLSTLLDDLDQRGMLRDTIVVALGEFGRTPKINHKAGRDHWHQCYSALVAGGGIRGGNVVGSSDKHAEHPLSNAVTPADLFTTVLDQMGIGTTQLTTTGLAPLGTPIEELV